MITNVREINFLSKLMRSSAEQETLRGLSFLVTQIARELTLCLPVFVFCLPVQWNLYKCLWRYTNKTHGDDDDVIIFLSSFIPRWGRRRGGRRRCMNEFYPVLRAPWSTSPLASHSFTIDPTRSWILLTSSLYVSTKFRMIRRGLSVLCTIYSVQNSSGEW